MTARILIVFSIVLIGANSSGQSVKDKPFFSVESISANTEEISYQIPLIKNIENPESAHKINQIIQMITVRKSYDVDKESIFSDLLNENGYGIVSLGYQILLNNESVLSIQFNDETMSSYPDYHTFYLNFNSSTGDIIDLNELFNSEGIDQINDIASINFNQKIKQAHFEIMEDTYFSAEQKKEELDLIFDLTECNATHKIWKYGFTEESIRVEKDRCFPHVIHAYDINWSSEIKIKELFSKGFTAYGENLLRESIPDKTKHYNQKKSVMTLHGKIDNKYPFTMYLRLNDDNSIGGYYWYDKFGDMINFRGERVSNRKIKLTEDSGFFILNIDNSGEISGTWRDQQGKLMPISFN